MKTMKTILAVAVAMVAFQANAQLSGNTASDAPVDASIPECNHKQTPIAYYSKWGNFQLGTMRLDDKKCRAVLDLPPCVGGRNDFVDSIQLVLNDSKAAADIDKLRVVYGNGATQELEVRELFNAGTTSRQIDLHGGDRCVRKIIIRGEALQRAGQDRVPAVIRIRSVTHKF